VKRIKRKSSIYQFLEPYLATGNDFVIAKARKEYWKAYKAEWRKKQRQETKEVTVVLTQPEAKSIIAAAKKHKRSPAQFIKESSFAYLSKQYVVPDVVAINTIRQLLAVNYNALQKLFDENMLPYQAGIALMQQMQELERKVLIELYRPAEEYSKTQKMGV
jgi:hypothetical protein